MSSTINSEVSSFFGKMLVVDLSSGKIEDKDLPREWADQYPGQKFIVWAASLHNARNLNQIEVQDSLLHALYQHKRVMGDVLWDELHGKMYSLAFTASEGEFRVWAAAEPTKLEVASSNSLEDLLVREQITDWCAVRTNRSVKNETS